MNTEILRDFEHITEGQFPNESLRIILENPMVFTPHLLEILRKVNKEYKTLEEGYWAHIPALFLLAYFREKAAFPLILEMISTESECLEVLVDDMLTFVMPQILASTYDGDFKKLTSVIENPHVGFWSRLACLDALIPLCAHQQITRNEFLDYIACTLREKCFDDNKELNGFLITHALEVKGTEIEAELRAAFKNDLIDETVVDLADLDRDLDTNRTTPSLEDLQKNTQHGQLVSREDVESIEEWAYLSYPPPIETGWIEMPKEKTKSLGDKKKKKKLKKAAKKQRRKNRA